MRHLLLFSILIFFFSLKLSAQAPKGINYQGVARDNEGKSIAAKKITVRISILKNSADGTTEYKETHDVTTNAFGLFTLVIGQGTVNTGSFDFISWAVGNKWLQIELDPNGGNSFQLIGSQQLMSVPYAMYAQYSSNGLTAGQGIAVSNGVINNTGDNDNSATNELNTSVTLGADHKLKITDAGGTKEADLSSLLGAAQNLTNVLAIGNDAGAQKIINLAAPASPNDAATKNYVDNHQDGDASSTNEIQDLSVTGNTLKITNNAAASSINLAGYLDNTDNQNLTLSGNTLSLTNDATTVDLSSYVQSLSVQSVDADTRSLTISGGNTISIEVGDNDNSSSNEIQNLNQVLTQSNDAGGLKLTNLGTPTISSDAATKLYVDNLDATDGDKSSTNEIQNINQVLTQGNDAGGLKLTNLGTPTANSDASTKLYVDNLDAADGDKSSTNEIQNITQVLTQGNNAGGLKLTNLGAPTVNSDAATKLYVDNIDAADADKSSTNEIQNLNQVLAQSNDAGGLKLTNLGAPTANADATTKLYVDNLDTADGDKSSTNEIQNLNQVLVQSNDAGGLKLTNIGTPTVNFDATTKLYVDNLDAADGDKSSTNEIQNITQVLTQGNNAGGLKLTNLGAPTVNSDATTKLYVDNLDAADGDKSSTNEIQNLNQVLTQSNDAGGLKLTNLGAPTTNSDATTKLYVDNLDTADGDKSSTNEIQNLNQVLTQSNNAGGLKLTNLGAPTVSSDATTKQYVDAADANLASQIATTYAFKTNFSYSNSTLSTQSDVTIPFTTIDFDDFSVIVGNTFTATQNGTYTFIVEGSCSAVFTGGQLSFLVNSTKYSINIIVPFGVTTPKFSATMMFKLTAGQTVSLVGDGVASASGFTGRFFGFKL